MTDAAPQPVVGGEIVGKIRLSHITGKSLKVIDNWPSQGCPVVEAPKTRGGDWKFSTSQVFAWLEKRARGDKPDLNVERARLAKEQADAQELKNQVSRGELLPAEVVVAGWESAIGRCRALLLGIPTSAAATIVLLTRQHEDAERAVREHLVKLIDGACDELTDTRVDAEEPDEAGVGDSQRAA